jgi:hypothetical protein
MEASIKKLAGALKVLNGVMTHVGDRVDGEVLGARVKRQVPFIIPSDGVEKHSLTSFSL